MKKFLILFIGFASLAFSHPHFFIDSKISIEEGVIKNEWVFDRLNSRVLMFDFDKNENNNFDEEEKQEFIKAHFLTLKDNNYNMFLAIDDEIKIEPKNMQVKVNKKRISLHFDIKADLGDFFTMCTMDEKIYMAYKLQEINAHNKLEIQKSEYDFCVGVEQ